MSNERVNNELHGLIYVWVEVEPDGNEGLISAVIPVLGGAMVPLMHRNRSMAEEFRPFAETHGKSAGRKVRLVEYTRQRILSEI